MAQYFSIISLVCLVAAAALLGGQLLLGPRGSRLVQVSVFFASVFLAGVGVAGAVLLGAGWAGPPDQGLGMALVVGAIIAVPVTLFARPR